MHYIKSEFSELDVASVYVARLKRLSFATASSLRERFWSGKEVTSEI